MKNRTGKNIKAGKALKRGLAAVCLLPPALLVLLPIALLLSGSLKQKFL